MKLSKNISFLTHSLLNTCTIQLQHSLLKIQRSLFTKDIPIKSDEILLFVQNDKKGRFDLLKRFSQYLHKLCLLFLISNAWDNKFTIIKTLCSLRFLSVLCGKKFKIRCSKFNVHCLQNILRLNDDEILFFVQNDKKYVILKLPVNRFFISVVLDDFCFGF